MAIPVVLVVVVIPAAVAATDMIRLKVYTISFTRLMHGYVDGPRPTTESATVVASSESYAKAWVENEYTLYWNEFTIDEVQETDLDGIVIEQPVWHKS